MLNLGQHLFRNGRSLDKMTIEEIFDEYEDLPALLVKVNGEAKGPLTQNWDLALAKGDAVELMIERAAPKPDGALWQGGRNGIPSYTAG